MEQRIIKRKRPTVEAHLEKYNAILKILDDTIETKSKEKEKGVRAFKTVRKYIKKMQVEVPYISFRKPHLGPKRTISGIMLTYPISNELIQFLKLPKGARLSRIEATRAICVYSNLKENETREQMIKWKYLNPNGKRDLRNPHDKRIIIPDKALSDLLHYEEYKKKIKKGKITRRIIEKETGIVRYKKVEKDCLYYSTIQKLITIHFINDEKLAN